MSKLSEQELIRREKLEELRKIGINPYPAAQFQVNFMAQDLPKQYEEGKKVVLAGRLMSRRIQGSASFAELLDSTGRIQLYFNRDEICHGEDKSQYNEVYKKLLDIGDIIGLEGTLFTTQVGQQTVKVSNFTLLNKSLRPLPLPKTDAEGNLYDAFNDPELRYRQRYVDLIVNPQVKNTFLQRSKITTTIRDFLSEKGYLEVETPILQPIPGGAAARPFVTHHNALNTKLYLRIANELYLKRLIVGGFEGVFEFAKDFRNEGMDRTHNPEFTVMELYVAYKDYFWMMETTETLLERIAQEVHQHTEIQVGTHKINFKAPYPRVPILEAIKTHTGVDISQMNEEELRKTATELGIEVNETMGEGKLIDEIFGEKCEHHYIQPTFITDYPKSMSPLTKEHRTHKNLTERFELMVNGKELANAYSELNDPIDQRERFESQLALSEKGDDEAMFIDQDFLRALEYGMPPTSGIGIGIDRLVMLMTNNSSIQEVLFFPQMKPEQKTIELSEEEKIILQHIKETSPAELITIKEKSELSNKKWDKAIKGLGQKKIVQVIKNEEGLFIEVLK
ncbi:lysine--tRNA ligase [Flavobacteriaceae bacterium]|jgi:lysyl-tRNA synthetase class 2|nr:lysine--tRNA ligase [Flavobacteriaceae bacterium]MDA7808167.1 lysine--tRNA ligase [Flavobacteriaceae bacterium]MDA8644589.1 lysine--tRNA ligase [Flavobacteriaceae bacterium]MDC0386459.1 lysine--tRNA ligase [Flavobacteriaceae bacterium]